MSLIQNRIMHPHLRDDEALVVENAIRIAIDSIINVLYSVNSARTQEYQRMVADRDKEIQRLECRSKENERELQVLRQQRCICGLVGNERRHVRADISSEPNKEEEANFVPSCIDSEMTIGQECEMNISCLFARTPSQVPPLSYETAPPPAPSKMALEQNCASLSSEAPGLSEETNRSSSVNNLMVKEEPSDIDTVLIKWEMSEQSFGDHQESSDTSCQDKESPSMKRKLENRERLRRFREKLYADPDRHRSYKEGERHRNSKRGVPMSELPEETQRLKRAAWRAASRRYYARKVARQQANPTQSGHLLQSTFLPRSQPQPVPLEDKKKKTLISELPEETQTLQREAWRAASRRYYARKMARLQTDPTGLGHFLQNTDPFGGTGGLSLGTSLNNDMGGVGGILCSNIALG